MTSVKLQYSKQDRLKAANNISSNISTTVELWEQQCRKSDIPFYVQIVKNKDGLNLSGFMYLYQDGNWSALIIE